MATYERYVVHGLHDWTLKHPCVYAKDSLEYLGDIFVRVQEAKYSKGIDFAELRKSIAEFRAQENREGQLAAVTEGR